MSDGFVGLNSEMTGPAAKCLHYRHRIIDLYSVYIFKVTLRKIGQLSLISLDHINWHEKESLTGLCSNSRHHNRKRKRLALERSFLFFFKYIDL